MRWRFWLKRLWTVPAVRGVILRHVSASRDLSRVWIDSMWQIPYAPESWTGRPTTGATSRA